LWFARFINYCISSEWIKCLIVIIILLWLHVLSIFGMCLYPHVVQKRYTGKQVWEWHTTTTKIKFIAKIMQFEDNRSRTTYDKVGPEGTPWVAAWPGSWPAGPPPPPLSPRFVHGQVWAQYTLIIYISSFVLIWIENHLLKHLNR
jgi:hypothetical protein